MCWHCVFVCVRESQWNLLAVGGKWRAGIRRGRVTLHADDSFTSWNSQHLMKNHCIPGKTRLLSHREFITSECGGMGRRKRGSERESSVHWPAERMSKRAGEWAAGWEDRWRSTPWIKTIYYSSAAAVCFSFTAAIDSATGALVNWAAAAASAAVLDTRRRIEP